MAGKAKNTESTVPLTETDEIEEITKVKSKAASKTKSAKATADARGGAKRVKKATAKPKKKSASTEVAKKERAILEKVWSRKIALEGLKRIFETALEGARIEIRDEDGTLVEVKFNPSAANAATKAVETANKMLGYTTPNEEEAADDGSIEVDFGEAEEFAL